MSSLTFFESFKVALFGVILLHCFSLLVHQCGVSVFSTLFVLFFFLSTRRLTKKVRSSINFYFFKNWFETFKSPRYIPYMTWYGMTHPPIWYGMVWYIPYMVYYGVVWCGVVYDMNESPVGPPILFCLCDLSWLTGVRRGFVWKFYFKIPVFDFFAISSQ